MPRRVEPNPFKDETVEPLTFDEITTVVFACAISMGLFVLLAMGAWTAGEHILWVLRG